MDPGKKIKKFRESKGLRQDEFAVAIGYSQGFLSEIERGAKPVSRHFLEQIMQVYGISADYILSTDKDLERHKKPERKEIFVSIKFLPDLKLVDRNWPDLKKCPTILVPMSATRASTIKGRIDHSYIMVIAGQDGMNPLISKGDLVVIDLDDKEVRERSVYLVKYKDRFLFRYVTLFSGQGVKGYFLNAQEAAMGTSFVPISDKVRDIILGRVLWVCKPLGER